LAAGQTTETQRPGIMIPRETELRRIAGECLDGACGPGADPWTTYLDLLSGEDDGFDDVMAIFGREERRDAALVGNVLPFPSARSVAS
jgi:hypothetical protein